MPDSSDVRREIEAEARRLFPGAVRRVEWLRHGDAPVIEPGEILPLRFFSWHSGAMQ